MDRPAPIVILNGAPRSGKSTVADALQAAGDRAWLNLGVDAWANIVPLRLHPGIGLRPSGSGSEGPSSSAGQVRRRARRSC
jgi:chloramphenicol 3-O phosphotransferase